MPRSRRTIVAILATDPLIPELMTVGFPSFGSMLATAEHSPLAPFYY
jgi:hypothetical protein